MILAETATEPEPADLDRRLRGPYFTIVGEPPVTVRVARRPDGTLACTGLLIGWETDAPITARAVAGIRLGAILAAIAALDNPDAAELLASAPRAPGPDVQDLQRWADAYKAAETEAPRAPVKYLVSSSGLSHATVHRILARCRDRGLLPRRYRL